MHEQAAANYIGASHARIDTRFYTSSDAYIYIVGKLYAECMVYFIEILKKIFHKAMHNHLLFLEKVMGTIII